MIGVSVNVTFLKYYFESLTKPQGMFIQMALDFMSVCLSVCLSFCVCVFVCASR